MLAVGCKQSYVMLCKQDWEWFDIKAEAGKEVNNSEEKTVHYSLPKIHKCLSCAFHEAYFKVYNS